MQRTPRSFLCLLFLAIFSISPKSYAQSTNGTEVSYPQNIVCNQYENFGEITDGSATHPHNIIMNFESSSDSQYIYSGTAKNWKDGGGGESVNAYYDSTTGKFLNGTSGIVCPPNL